MHRLWPWHEYIKAKEDVRKSREQVTWLCSNDSNLVKVRKMCNHAGPVMNAIMLSMFPAIVEVLVAYQKLYEDVLKEEK